MMMMMNALAIDIRGCRFSDNSVVAGIGAGVHITLGGAAQGSVSIDDLHFDGNAASTSGGAIAIAAPKSNPLFTGSNGLQDFVFTISNAVLEGNSAETGGAINFDVALLQNVSIAFANLTATNNTAAQYGGGCFVAVAESSSNVSITCANSVFESNDALVAGGVFYISKVEEVQFTLSNSSFVDNNGATAAVMYLDGGDKNGSSSSHVWLDANTFSSDSITSQLVLLAAAINVSANNNFSSLCPSGSNENISVNTGESWRVDCIRCERSTYQLPHCTGDECRECPETAICEGGTSIEPVDG